MKRIIISLLGGILIGAVISAPIVYGLATHIEAAMPLTRTQISYDTSDRAQYLGKNVQAATDASTDWILKKLTYNANDDVIDIEVALGTWTGRASNSQWK